jgi:hypothetical protein
VATEKSAAGTETGAKILLGETTLKRIFNSLLNSNLVHESAMAKNCENERRRVAADKVRAIEELSFFAGSVRSYHEESGEKPAGNSPALCGCIFLHPVY